MSRECGLRLQKPTYCMYASIGRSARTERRTGASRSEKNQETQQFHIAFTDFRVPHSSRPSLDFESRLLLRAPVGTTGSIECYSRDISLIVRTYIQRLHSDVLLSESRHQCKNTKRQEENGECIDAKRASYQAFDKS